MRLEGEQDRDAAARRPAVGKQVRVGVEQVERRAVPLHLPAEAVEAEGWPDLSAAAVVVVQLKEGGVQARHPRMRVGTDGKWHGFTLPFATEPCMVNAV